MAMNRTAAGGNRPQPNRLGANRGSAMNRTSNMTGTPRHGGNPGKMHSPSPSVKVGSGPAKTPAQAKTGGSTNDRAK